jgi:hypothetical protein
MGWPAAVGVLTVVVVVAYWPEGILARLSSPVPRKLAVHAERSRCIMRYRQLVSGESRR